MAGVARGGWKEGGSEGRGRGYGERAKGYLRLHTRSITDTTSRIDSASVALGDNLDLPHPSPLPPTPFMAHVRTDLLVGTAPAPAHDVGDGRRGHDEHSQAAAEMTGEYAHRKGVGLEQPNSEKTTVKGYA